MFKLLVNHNKKDSLVNRFRQKRFTLLKGQLEQLIQTQTPFRILDIGGDLAYWNHIGWKHEQCKICLLNLYPITLTQDEAKQFESIQGSALDMPVKKGEFDLFFSNSVIEHLGSHDNQQHFANEVKRLAEKYIIQTPSIWFPLEPHSLIPFFQFIPHSIRAYLIMCFNINYFPKAATYSEALMVSKTTLMLTKKQFQALFPEAVIRVERLFGIPKSYTAIKL